MNDIVNDRDMFYGGYYQNTPCNMQYGNFGFQGMPGSLMNNGTFPNIMGYPNTNTNIVDLNGNASNQLSEINTRINNLESRLRLLEQRVSNNNNYQEDNNSMYMI